MSDAIDQGIRVTELAAMDLPINVAQETTAAFVGRALRGPLNIPVLVENFAAFQRRFGGVWHRSSLGPAVKQFFEHGGARLYIVRVANNARGAMIALPASGGVLVLHALEPGSTENIRAAVDYDRIDPADNEHFNLVVQRLSPGSGLVLDQEIFSRVSCQQDSKSYVGSVLLDSSLVRARLPVPSGRPLATTGDDNGYVVQYVGHAQRGSDGANLCDYDLIGSSTRATGMFALHDVAQFDLLYFPPLARDRDPGTAVILAAEQYCRQRGAMLIVDPPADWADANDAVNGIRESGYASSNIVGYFPRVTARNAQDRKPRVAGGALTGLLCKLDRVRDTWEDLDQVGFGISRSLKPAIDLSIEDAQQLVRGGLNVIAGSAAGKAAFCGSVTLGSGSQMDRRFSDLTVRRLCLKITNAIRQGTRWAVFESDAARIGERILGQVDGYMSHLANAGAFEDNRFAIQCDVELKRAANDPQRGINIMLTFRPAGSHEDVSLTLHQTIAGCRVAATAFAPVRAAVA